MLAQRGAEEPELREPRHELDRKAFGSEARVDDRQGFALDESRNSLLHELLAFAEQTPDVV